MKKNRDHSGVTRGEIVANAVVATSGVALAASLPSALAQTAPAHTCPTETLRKIGEIVSTKKHKLLKRVLKITNGPKVLPGYDGSVHAVIRFFEGNDQQAAGHVLWAKC